MLNRIVLIGRLTRDPESQYTPSGVALAKFAIAVNRFTKNPETGDYEVDFIDVVAWRRTAEFVTQYLTKGRLVSVEGRLQIRSWVAQDGTKRKAAEVVADGVESLDKPREGEGGVAQAPAGQEYAGKAGNTGGSGSAVNAGSAGSGGEYAAPQTGTAAPARRPAPPAEELDEIDPFADE